MTMSLGLTRSSRALKTLKTLAKYSILILILKVVHLPYSGQNEVKKYSQYVELKLFDIYRCLFIFYNYGIKTIFFESIFIFAFMSEASIIKSQKCKYVLKHYSVFKQNQVKLIYFHFPYSVLALYILLLWMLSSSLFC